jgi:prefoldin alpha subunit
VSASETELRRNLAVLDQYREQMEAFAQQQEIVRISLEEHLRAKETLLRYRETGEAAEILVPVGANSFVVVASKDVKKAFVSIGSDLLVHDDIDRQLERLDARIKSITEAANAIAQRLGELQRRAEAQGAMVQNMYEQMQTQPGARERT